jgi:uncharacterized protein YbbC (DUF1343 family)
LIRRSPPGKLLAMAIEFQFGLEVCLAHPPPILKEGAAFGLLANQASVDGRFQYSRDRLAERFPVQLRALFSPQHGLFGTEQANMIGSDHRFDDRLKVPVHSLYQVRSTAEADDPSGALEPSEAMLDGLDCLLVDLQDVGTRVYTFIWTVTYCLSACAKKGIPVIVLDRPNPLGGRSVEGPLLDPAYASFVGRAAIPMRHGLTLGEVSSYLNQAMALGARLDVVPVRGWSRAAGWPDSRTWLAPSPNLARLEGVRLYPGGVLFEGTCLSEGRGTTTPFEIYGAPFINGHSLADCLRAYDLPGLVFRPVRFKPTFDKWSGQECGGVFVHVTDPEQARPYAVAVALLASVRQLWPDDFRWLPPPYEFESRHLPIDILSGSQRLRQAVDQGLLSSAEQVRNLAGVDEHRWWTDTADHRIDSY